MANLIYYIATNVKVTAITTTSILEQQLNTPKYTQSFQRVIQTIPTNVAITTQPASIKVITPNQPPATALVVSKHFIFISCIYSYHNIEKRIEAHEYIFFSF